MISGRMSFSGALHKEEATGLNADNSVCVFVYRGNDTAIFLLYHIIELCCTDILL